MALHTVPVSQSIKFDLLCQLSDAYVWHRSMQGNKVFHPAVSECLETEQPRDLRQLYTEWPHVSTDGRLAYTQNPDKGERGIQTVTTIGRYIAKHFDMPDHIVRAIVSKHSASGYVISNDRQIIRNCVIKGPRSCMQWDDGDYLNLNNPHPYDVYSPDLGWSVCYKEENGQIVSRGLLHDKVFVRTYRRADEGSYSQRDEQMEQFLIGKGFTHADSWRDGSKLKKMGMLPYLDGGNQRVDDEGECFIIRRGGSICCDNTDGTIDDGPEYMCHCDYCGTGIQEGDDYGHEGEEYENAICESCLQNHYTYVIGRRGNEYYIRDNNAIHVGGQAYDPEYLSDNDIIELDNGDYVSTDDAFCCPIDDCWYHYRDGVDTQDNEYVHKSNAWQCSHSGDWYSTQVDPVSTQDAGDCHEDNAWKCAATGNWYSNDVDPAVNEEGENIHPLPFTAAQSHPEQLELI